MIIIYATFPDSRTSDTICRSLLDKRLVACANIFSPHRALYHWEGKIEDAKEIAVLFKTKPEHFEAVRAVIIESHPYDTPCIVSWNIADGHPPFIDWIKGEVL